jgi:thiamine-phosphate pyrophosphorylase
LEGDAVVSFQDPVMTDTAETARLYLVAPPRIELAGFVPRLEAALGSGDVAAVLLGVEDAGEDMLAPLVQTIQRAVDSFRPKRIVGAGGLSSRHAAMQAAELDIDYVFFGHPHRDTHDAAHPKAVELAEWWSELMQVPAVLMAGRSLDSVAEAAATGADFVALHAAVWSHSQGPGEAVRQAAATLAQKGRRAA